MSENPLANALSQSIQVQGLGEALKYLQSCHSILSSYPEPHTLLDLKVTTLLNRLNSKYSSQIYSPLSRIYLSISKIADKAPPAVLLKLCNDILMLTDSLKYTDIADLLSDSVQHLLQSLSATELEESQQEVVTSLLKKDPLPNLEETFKGIVQAISENRVSGIHELFDVFSSFDSFKVQLEIFSTKLFPVLEAIQKIQNPEIIKKLLVFLEHFIFKFNYNVQIGEFTEIYNLVQIDKITTSMLSTTLMMINAILAYDISTTQNLLLILQRLWSIFPQETESFYDITVLTLSAIATQGTAEFKVKASGFLYEILNTPGFPQRLKDSLEDSTEINLLMKDEAFSPSSSILESENIIKIEDLQPVVGLPLNANIPAGEEFYYIIEIIEANSIITWGFATEYYDINFEIIRIDLPTPQTVIKQDLVQCSESPHTGSKLISSPGLYKFIWTNKHSWFTSKHVRFRISVLTPYHKVNNNEKDLHKVIEMIIDDGIPPADKDVLEVGIICKNKIVILSSNGITQEIPDLDILAIQDYLKRIKGERKISSVKIGIIGRIPKRRNEFKVFGAVAMSRDVDAIALLNESEMHYNTLICVMCEEGSRSCVIHRGKVMVDANGTPIADLYRAGINDVYVGISTLLSLFGPAVVVICGQEAPSVEDVVDRIKTLVPEAIMQESLIRATVFGAQASIMAASKLHLLNNKFRINH